MVAKSFDSRHPSQHKQSPVAPARRPNLLSPTHIQLPSLQWHNIPALLYYTISLILAFMVWLLLPQRVADMLHISARWSYYQHWRSVWQLRVRPSLVHRITHSKYVGFNPVDHTASLHLPPNDTSAATAATASDTLVILLGWSGSHKRQLKNYIQYYHSHGLPVVAYINPWLSLMNSALLDSDELVECLRIAKGYASKRSHSDNGNGGAVHPPLKLYIHALSNNGSAALTSLLHTLNEDALTAGQPVYSDLQLAGIIFDSTPSSLHIATHVRNTPMLINSYEIGTRFSRPLVADITKGKAIRHWLYTPLIVSALFILFTTLQLYGVTPSIGTMDERLRTLLTPHGGSYAYNVPQLFLYSDADKLIDSTSVEQWIAYFKQYGNNTRITSHNFVDSPHVAHLKYHREKYIHLITQFMHATTVSQSRRVQFDTN